MNGTSGFGEVWSSTSSRSLTNRFLHEQRPKLETGSWQLLLTHTVIAFFTDIRTKHEMVPDTFPSFFYRGT